VPVFEHCCLAEMQLNSVSHYFAIVFATLSHNSILTSFSLGMLSHSYDVLKDNSGRFLPKIVKTGTPLL